MLASHSPMRCPRVFDCHKEFLSAGIGKSSAGQQLQTSSTKLARSSTAEGATSPSCKAH